MPRIFNLHDQPVSARSTLSRCARSTGQQLIMHEPKR
jgi:hypothetical protein